MTTPKHIDAVINFLASQVDGEQPPQEDSAVVRELVDAIAAIQKDGSDWTLSMLGLRAVGLVIDRMHSGIAAEQALRDIGGLD